MPFLFLFPEQALRLGENWVTVPEALLREVNSTLQGQCNKQCLVKIKSEISAVCQGNQIKSEIKINSPKTSSCKILQQI